MLRAHNPDDAAKPAVRVWRYIPIVAASCLGRVDYYVCCRDVVGASMHWHASCGERGRLLPHLIDRTKCRGCIDALGTRWRGYLGCWHLGVQRHVIAELTVDAMRNNFVLHPLEGHDLRGRKLTLARTGRTNTSPVRAEVTQPFADISQWPNEFDVRSQLAHIWGYDSVSPICWLDYHEGM